MAALRVYATPLTRACHTPLSWTPLSTDLIRRPWDADDLLAAVEMTEHANKKIKTLSGGQRRRLDVAIGLVGRPEVLFLDEPTTGLDPKGRREFHSLVRQVTARGDTTIVLTTHDLDEAEKLANRIIILSAGRIIADGTPGELSRQIVGADEVRWTQDGQRFAHSTPDSTRFARELFIQYGDAIGELEVRRAALESTYLTLVARAESGHGDTEIQDSNEVA